jgi:hypothetical protein
MAWLDKGREEQEGHKKKSGHVGPPFKIAADVNPLGKIPRRGTSAYIVQDSGQILAEPKSDAGIRTGSVNGDRER